jgi:hypothetical protein
VLLNFIQRHAIQAQCRKARREERGREGATFQLNRRSSNGEQVNRLAGLAMTHKPSVDFSGYWQRHVQTDARFGR